MQSIYHLAGGCLQVLWLGVKHINHYLDYPAPLLYSNDYINLCTTAVMGFSSLHACISCLSSDLRGSSGGGFVVGALPSRQGHGFSDLTGASLCCSPSHRGSSVTAVAQYSSSLVVSTMVINIHDFFNAMCNIHSCSILLNKF